LFNYLDLFGDSQSQPALTSSGSIQAPGIFFLFFYVCLFFLPFVLTFILFVLSFSLNLFFFVLTFFAFVLTFIDGNRTRSETAINQKAADQATKVINTFIFLKQAQKGK
jgi:hypothetical protein